MKPSGRRQWPGRNTIDDKPTSACALHSCARIRQSPSCFSTRRWNYGLKRARPNRRSVDVRPIIGPPIRRNVRMKLHPNRVTRAASATAQLRLLHPNERTCLLRPRQARPNQGGCLAKTADRSIPAAGLSRLWRANQPLANPARPVGRRRGLSYISMCMVRQIGKHFGSETPAARPCARRPQSVA
jgi:hypothetical protein